MTTWGSRSTVPALILGATLALTGCSGDEGRGADDETTASASPVSTAEKVVAALQAGDCETVVGLTYIESPEISEDDLLAECAQVEEGGAEAQQDLQDLMVVEEVELTADDREDFQELIDGEDPTIVLPEDVTSPDDFAKVSYVVGDAPPNEDNFLPMIRTDNRWMTTAIAIDVLVVDV